MGKKRRKKERKEGRKGKRWTELTFSCFFFKLESGWWNKWSKISIRIAKGCSVYFAFQCFVFIWKCFCTLHTGGQFEPAPQRYEFLT